MTKATRKELGEEITRLQKAAGSAQKQAQSHRDKASRFVRYALAGIEPESIVVAMQKQYHAVRWELAHKAIRRRVQRLQRLLNRGKKTARKMACEEAVPVAEEKAKITFSTPDITAAAAAVKKLSFMRQYNPGGG